MSKAHEVRLKFHAELEAPPALRRFGSGWISGVSGCVLGLAGLFLVLSLRAPGLFSMSHVRTLHDHTWFRLVIHFTLPVAFALSSTVYLARTTFRRINGLQVTACRDTRCQMDTGHSSNTRLRG